MNNTQLPEDDNVTAAGTGTLRPVHLIVIALVVVVIGAAALYVVHVRRQAGPEPTGRDGVVVVPEGSRSITLYFAETDKAALLTETRQVAIGQDFIEQIEQVMRALLEGPDKRGVSTIAPGTRLLNVFYDSETATAYLDFSSEIVAGHPGGSSAEYFTIAAIMRTVSENFPEVRAVQLLVEGLQVGTIGGHIDAHGPFVVSEWR